MNETWTAGLILIVIVLMVIAIPCFFVAFLGYQMLHKLAYYPSKNPAIQMSIFFWLIIVEIASVAMLIAFYHIFADYSNELNQEGAKNYECVDVYIAIHRPHDDPHGRYHLLFA